MNDTISIKLPYKTEYIAIARMTATYIGNQLAFNVEDLEDIKLAVSEACNNAIQHSGQRDSAFDIDFHIEQDKLTTVITDHGEGYAMNDYKQPNINDLKENGLGIFIMNSLMDDVKISSEKQQGTVITLVKYLTK